MRNENLNNCMDRLQSVLMKLRGIMEGDPNYDGPKDQLGFDVWILPSWYHATLEKDRVVVRTVVDFSASFIDRPRLKRVGHLAGGEGEKANRVKWTIGKGLLNQAMFAPTGMFETLIYGVAWPTATETLPPRHFRKLDPTITQGHSRKEIRHLNSRYACATAVALKREGEAVPFGCLIAHTPRDEPLSSDALNSCGLNLVIISEKVIEIIDSQLRPGR